MQKRHTLDLMSLLTCLEEGRKPHLGCRQRQTVRLQGEGLGWAGGAAYLDLHAQRRGVCGQVEDGVGEVGQRQGAAAVDVDHLVAAPPWWDGGIRGGSTTR